MIEKIKEENIGLVVCIKNSFLIEEKNLVSSYEKISVIKNPYQKNI